ncbi:hypothetical protein WA158_002733 [Blastocystis sp. Blastoise]
MELDEYISIFNREKTNCTVQSQDYQNILFEENDPIVAAGCMIWDESTRMGSLQILMKNNILDMISTKLNEDISERLTEVCCGILMNISLHSETLPYVVNHDYIPSQIINLFMTVNNTDIIQYILTIYYQIVINNEYREIQSWTIFQYKDVYRRIFDILKNTLSESLFILCVKYLSYCIFNKFQNASVVLLRVEVFDSIPDLLEGILKGNQDIQAFSEDAILLFLRFLQYLLPDFITYICSNNAIKHRIESLLQFVILYNTNEFLVGSSSLLYYAIPDSQLPLTESSINHITQTLSLLANNIHNQLELTNPRFQLCEEDYTYLQSLLAPFNGLYHILNTTISSCYHLLLPLLMNENKSQNCNELIKIFFKDMYDSLDLLLSLES